VNDALDPFRDWDAAYVVGALSTDDRRSYERHLATCEECAASVAELAGLPGILSKLPADAAVSLLSTSVGNPIDDSHLRIEAHVPGIVQRLAGAETRRRRRIRITMLAAAAIVVALFVGGGVALFGNQQPATPSVAMSALRQNEITASLQITRKGWGTRFDWNCAYKGDAWEGTASSYDLVVVDKTGARTTVATWTAAGPKASGLTASSAIPTNSISSVEIRLTGTTTPLLSERL
jgi:hypothetical protein